MRVRRGRVARRCGEASRVPGGELSSAPGPPAGPRPAQLGQRPGGAGGEGGGEGGGRRRPPGALRVSIPAGPRRSAARESLRPAPGLLAERGGEARELGDRCGGGGAPSPEGSWPVRGVVTALVARARGQARRVRVRRR